MEIILLDSRFGQSFPGLQASSERLKVNPGTELWTLGNQTFLGPERICCYWMAGAPFPVSPGKHVDIAYVSREPVKTIFCVSREPCVLFHMSPMAWGCVCAWSFADLEEAYAWWPCPVSPWGSSDLELFPHVCVSRQGLTRGGIRGPNSRMGAQNGLLAEGSSLPYRHRHSCLRL